MTLLVEMEIIIKVNSTYNNTIVSALYNGKILKTVSTGSVGFKKAKRASTLAAQTCGEAIGSWLLKFIPQRGVPVKGLNNSTISKKKPQDDIKKAHIKPIAPATSGLNASVSSTTPQRGVAVNSVNLLIAGVGYGKFGVIRGLSKLGIKIKTISDVTSIPHNGCKPPKMRRK